MRFNGADLRTVHPAISRSQEFPPGMAKQNITTVETSAGSVITAVEDAQDEYTVRVNIAGRTYREAMEARERLAAWAASSGKAPALLEPTHRPGKAYNAIVKSIGRIEQRFGTVDVVFLLIDGKEMDAMLSSAQATNKELVFQTAGSAETQVEVRFTVAKAAEGLRISHNGKSMIALRDAFAAGDLVRVVLETGEVTVNGELAGHRVIYTESDFDTAFTPGRHVLNADAEGTLEARWHNKWL